MSENEIKSYDLPLTEDFDAMTPDVAQAEIDKVLSAASVDPKHPYCDAHGYKHRQHTERMSKLFEVAGKGKPSVFEKVLAEAKAEQDTKRNKLIAEGQQKLAALKKLGFPPVEFEPENTTAYHIRGWDEQILMAKSKFDELRSWLLEDANRLRIPKDDDFFRGLRDMDEFQSVEAKTEVADRLIRYVFDTDQARSRPKVRTEVSPDVEFEESE
jgi:hypothetical protein